jgi:hypothetical protein
MQQASIRTGITSNLQEGLVAYAAEMADMEHSRLNAWRTTWEIIRERADLVLKKFLNDRGGEEGLRIPRMTVEIDIEDGPDLYHEFSDAE